VGVVRLLIAYQGTNYHGWQIQPDETTLQGTLEEAFFKMTGQKTRINAASRTDTGVHAAGQVACLVNDSRHEPHQLREGLNALLPAEVVVLEAAGAPEGFDPRREAVGKHYRYTIHNSRVRPLFERAFRWHIKKPLDVAAMDSAGACLIGEHDFSAFRGANCTAKTTVRTLDGLAWRSEPPALILDVWGRGFLKQMVRNIVGTSVEIGRGRWPAGKMAAILQSKRREEAGLTAPAQGLCLMKVFFDAEEYRSAVAGPDQAD
jgi:tRNA pseudouridine38-40 synthase